MEQQGKSDSAGILLKLTHMYSPDLPGWSLQEEAHMMLSVFIEQVHKHSELHTDSTRLNVRSSCCELWFSQEPSGLPCVYSVVLLVRVLHTVIDCKVLLHTRKLIKSG